MLHRTHTILASLILTCCLATAAAAQGPIPTPIPHGPIQVDVQLVAGGLAAPNLLIPAPDNTNRQFVLDQPGQVRIIQNGTLLPTPFLDLSAQINTLVNTPNPPGLRPNYDERGLLGMAFDPNFNNPASPGFHRVFTYHSEGVSGPADFPQVGGTPNHQSVISSWIVDPSNLNQVLPGSRQVIMRIDEPQFNHNAGMLAFGPDGDLYIALGDGGNANDVGTGHNPTIGNAQDLTTPLGKILRIDPNGNNSANGKYGIPPSNPFASGGGLKEIYAYGFRNPFRYSFDGSRLLVADVGQNNIEELDDVTLGGNYGWHYKEGTFKFNPADGSVSSDLTGLPGGLIDPILQYDHDEGIAIVGGSVYHGSAIPQLQGKYVFGDFSRSFAGPQGRLFYADLSTPGDIHEFILGATDHSLGLFVKGMGVDAAGELYVLAGTTLGPSGTTGAVYKIVPVPEPSMLMLAAGAASLPLARRRQEAV